MSRPWPIVLILTSIIISLLVGCQPLVATPTISFDPPTPTAELGTPTPLSSAAPRELVIILTNDEHGYLLPVEDKDFYYGGAAYSAASWTQKGYDPSEANPNVLLLSGGDSWTGPAISTWVRGESAVEVMNLMGYRASAIGNHEFDFGQEVIRQRAAQAKFPFLAANLYRQGTQESPDFVEPYAIIEIQGLHVGVIGLALRETPTVVAANNLQGLTFGDYEPTLRRWVPVVKQKGAQVVIVLSHICPDDLLVLASEVQDLGISLFTGGHCHEARVTTIGNSVIAVSSAHWNDYALAKLTYDPQTGQVVKTEQQLVDVLVMKTAQDKLKPDPQITQAIAKWNERVQLALGQVIGYTASGLRTNSPAMHNLLVDSWLWAYPNADLAISNTGGFRQDLAAGEITIEDIVGVLPFDNELVEISATGQEVLRALDEAGSQFVLGGMRRNERGQIVLLRDGQPLNPQATYRVLITDYLYSNKKYLFYLYDDEPYETSILWRQPVIDWITAQHSNAENPLDRRIDSRAR